MFKFLISKLYSFLYFFKLYPVSKLTYLGYGYFFTVLEQTRVSRQNTAFVHFSFKGNICWKIIKACCVQQYKVKKKMPIVRVKHKSYISYTFL